MMTGCRWKADKRTIREVHLAWIDAANAGDIGRLLSLMADDVVFLNPGLVPFDKDAFSPGFSAAHEQFRIHCVSELEEVVVVGEVAYTRSLDALSMTPRGGPQATQGEPMQLAGHRMTVYRKQSDGRWIRYRLVKSVR